MTMPSYCRSCGARLGLMDRVYCPEPSCQEEARKEAMGARFRAIASELGFGGEDAGSMPKERLLVLLDKDARKYSLEGPSPDLGFMTSFVVLAEKVKKHPWDDCAKFLAERGEIIQRIEIAERVAEAAEAQERAEHGRRAVAALSAGSGKVSVDRNSAYPSPGGWGDPYAEDLRLADVVRVAGTPSGRLLKSRSAVGDRFSGGRFTGPSYDGMTLPPQAVFEDVMKFGPMVIGPEVTQIFQAAPPSYFQGTHLFVSSKIAPAFMLEDLRVGTMSQFSSNPIPMTAFTENAVGIALGIDAATPGILLTMIVRNISPSPRVFEAFLRGRTMR